jgi:hypothetical protein
MNVMIMRSENEIRDKIEQFSYIFDISDELRIKYERTTLNLYPLQLDDYIKYGIILALEWILGIRDSLDEKMTKKDRE